MNTPYFIYFVDFDNYPHARCARLEFPAMPKGKRGNFWHFFRKNDACSNSPVLPCLLKLNRKAILHIPRMTPDISLDNSPKDAKNTGNSGQNVGLRHTGCALGKPVCCRFDPYRCPLVVLLTFVFFINNSKQCALVFYVAAGMLPE